MKSSDDDPGRFFKRKPNIYLAAIAVVIGVILWVFVSRKDLVDTEIEVGIDYNKIPANLVITDGQISKILVRLRGPERLLRTLSRERYPINLSDIKKGENLIPLSQDKILDQMKAQMRGFKIIDIQPPRIELIADAIADKTVPVRVEYDSPLSDEALTIENLSVIPSTVVLKGPEKTLAGISFLPVVVRPDPKITGQVQTLEPTLDTDNFVTADPSRVKVQFIITSERVAVTRDVPVTIAGDLQDHYEINPAFIKLVIEVPEALSKDVKYIQQCRATVAPPPMEEGKEKTLPITIVTPEGMKILSPPPKNALVTKISN
ncbi:MAG: YbbR-like domain-containing protein [Desulfovibrio sp.]|nr:YbbR-like domain-containing protein [Desulfovibrio sp.]